MNKVKKNALKTGADKDNTYYFYCPKCGKQNTLNAKRCVNCKTKRPEDAYEQALEMLKPKDAYCGYADRTVKNAFPTPLNPIFAVPLSSNSSENGYINNSLLNVPDYYSTDEYGRVFKTNVTYGALPCSAPVPVPIPSKIVQVAPINLPYNTNNTNN